MVAPLQGRGRVGRSEDCLAPSCHTTELKVEKLIYNRSLNTCTTSLKEVLTAMQPKICVQNWLWKFVSETFCLNLVFNLLLVAKYLINIYITVGSCKSRACTLIIVHTFGVQTVLHKCIPNTKILAWRICSVCQNLIIII